MCEMHVPYAQGKCIACPQQSQDLIAMFRCSGTTKAGNRCSITSRSTLTNDRGRLISEPLLRGGEYCLLHAKPFCNRPAVVNPSRALFLLIDLETTGVDIAQDRIVELAATHVPSNPSVPGGSFSTVLRVDETILKDRGGEAAKVHGIAEAEIAEGPRFPEAWHRFTKWTDDLLNSAVQESEQDTSDDERHGPEFIEEPILILAAHNGIRFDFPLLLCEVVRHGIDPMPFRQWLFVDTLHLFQDCGPQHGCAKLQCLSLRLMVDSGRAHRALDDVLSLRSVSESLAQSLGLTLPSLLARFAVEVDLPSSLAQLSVLMS